MKTIFIFNDSCLTDLRVRMTALGEDGRRIATVVFDCQTQSHLQYAFGCTHELPEQLSSMVVAALRGTRRDMFAAYDQLYGEGQWMPMLVDDPATNPGWLMAMELYRSRASASERRGALFSDTALARIFDTVIGASQSFDVARTVH